MKTTNTTILNDIIRGLNRRKRLKGEDTPTCAVIRNCIEALFELDVIQEYSNYNTALRATIGNVKELIRREFGRVGRYEWELLEKFSRELWVYGEKADYNEVCTNV